MARGRLTMRMASAVLLPALLASSPAFAHSLYRCRHDQVARAERCCPHEEVGKAADQGSTSSALSRGCCDREVVRADAVFSTELRRASAGAEAGIPCVMPTRLPLPERGAEAAFAGASESWPDPGPPAYLLVCSLLI